MTFISNFGNTLESIEATVWGKSVVSTSSDPGSLEQCAAYCQIASSDCMAYSFDEGASTCYAGMIETTSGSMSTAGNVQVQYHTGTF